MEVMSDYIFVFLHSFLSCGDSLFLWAVVVSMTPEQVGPVQLVGIFLRTSDSVMNERVLHQRQQHDVLPDHLLAIPYETVFPN